MTKVIKHYPGKRLRHFWANKETEAYFIALAEMSGIPDISETKKGRNGGTYCHPKLAVFFARWLDVRFAVWCDLIIDNILHGHLQVQSVVPTREVQALEASIREAQSLVLGLTAEKKALEGKVKALQEEGFKGLVPDGWMTAWCFLEDIGVAA